MIKSKIIDILGNLSRDELKKFSDYLSSPVFNKREIILKLFNAYKRHYPEFEGNKFTKEKIFRKILPGKEYNDEIFRNLNSQLLKLAEEFLSYLNYSGNIFNVKKHLLLEINSRKLLSLFEKNFEETKRIIGNDNKRDLEFFYHEYNLYLQKDIYNSYINKFSKKDIFEAEKNLLVFYLIKMMEIQNYILYESRILGLDGKMFLDSNFAGEILKNVPDEINDLPQIKIYYNALKLEQTNKSVYYRNLRNLLNEHGHLIEKEKHYNKYIDMIDYIKRNKPREDTGTVRELFQLRREIIEKGLFTGNFITNMFFLNLVKSGTRLKEFGWVEHFIEKYYPLLIEKYRESTRELSYAYLYFDKNEYDISMSHLAKVRYEDIFYNLEVRNMTSRIYYETESYDLLNDFLNSYRMYLSKNRSVSKQDYESHNLFISITGSLYKIKESGKIHRLDDLEEKAVKKDFINRYWVIEKIRELEK
ncbi:MAG: hypothetical protein JNJ56_07910 [Ignavibacteria bacterium]|nr:hypothetical protein [Ignavibacteria bacterium]